MISEEKIAEWRRADYLNMGVRESKEKLVCDLVFDDFVFFIVFVLTKRKKDIEYEVKVVTLVGRSYIVCCNCEEMKKDVVVCVAILVVLEW